MTFIRVYPYTDFAIEIWGFYRRLTDTLRYHYTRCSRASGLQLAAILQMFANGRKVEFNRSCPLFLASFGKLYDCRTKFNSSLGMEYNGELYGFSAMKVKLVDSLI